METKFESLCHRLSIANKREKADLLPFVKTFILVLLESDSLLQKYVVIITKPCTFEGLGYVYTQCFLVAIFTLESKMRENVYSI